MSESAAQSQSTQVELSDAEKQSVFAVRKQSDAKAAAEKLLGKRVRPKVIRGRCCLFVGSEQSTLIFGHTWQEAFMVLLFRHKLGAIEEALKKAAASNR